MTEMLQASEPALVGCRRQRIIRYDRDHGGTMARADLPHMQVSDTIAPGLDPVADHGFQILVGANIEQYRTGITDQPTRPAGDHEAANEADHRIGPDPLRVHRDRQRRDRKQRGRGIGQHVDIGGAKVVVVMVMIAVSMGMRMTVTMMVVIIAEQPGARKIDTEAERCNRNRLAIGDRNRVNES